ncbi:thioredoxin family protein [Pseudomonas sp. PDNC002]|uniref:thioredoxin family protein n=1 Tax=Pseudomonas sp. PDNC002 TaxID=2811422 RepID=UPI0019665AFD|nr:thioredoxin family protein [Pseudomonas sp. PDNC002]QRY77021.1 thioredoxin family protein [Pseudomonas sp. PDNC002]
MTERSDCNLYSVGNLSIVPALELSDLDADRRLLELPGVSLLIFTSPGCSSCRWARQALPEFGLPVDRLCWVDAGHNGGLVERYEVFHLPSLFLVRDGHFLGPIHAPLRPEPLIHALRDGLSRPAEELP